MLDGKRFVLNPFTNQILTKFDVMVSFGGHIMRPLDASVIVVVEKSRLGSVRKTMARCAHTGAEVSKVNDLFQSCVCSTYLSFTQTESCTVLAFAKPSKRTTVAKDNAAAHTPKLEKWKKGTVGNGATNLRAPTSIAVRGECRRGLRCWWESIGIGFHVSRRRKVYVTMHRSHSIGGERNTVIVGRVYVVQSIESCLHMSHGRLVAVGGKTGVGS